MSGRRERYTVQQVLDHLDGNFAIPEDGFDSDIEGFESDIDDDLEPQLPPQERENNDIDLRNVIIEDEEEEEAENSDVRAAGRPNNYSFDGLEWTDAPQDVPALLSLEKMLDQLLCALQKCPHWITFCFL